MKSKASKELKELWHEDPNNWFLGFLYFNKQDPRTLVPKKNPFMGWTVNFANRYSYIILAAIVALILVVKTTAS